MFRAIAKDALKAFLICPNVQQNQLRTTFILKRKHGDPLYKEGLPKRKLRNRYYIYELIKDTRLEPKEPIQVILTKYVKGLGDVGDLVSVKPYYAYDNLLVPGLAVYASPQNREKYKDIHMQKKDVIHSSKHAQTTVDYLSYASVSIVMNKETPWTLQPWHVKASFRKAGFEVPEDAITMPSKEIKGPNLDLEGKYFYITVTINNLEQVKVRCNIHHWSTNLADRLPHVHDFWKKPIESVFEDETELMKSFPNKHTEKRAALGI